MPIEVRQGCDPAEVCFVLVLDEREPQAQLGEPDCRELQVHSEERVRHHVPAHARGGPFTRGAAQPGELLECTEQERSRTDGRVHNGQSPQVGARRRAVGGRSVMQPAFGGSRSEAEPMHERPRKAGTHDLPHQRRRRVIAAAGAALYRVHHALEDAAQHVGRDRRAVLALPRREVEALEQIVEGITPVGVGPPGGPVASLEAGRLEQTAVQKRQIAQGACRAGALSDRPIEGTEAQRIEHMAMEVAAGGRALVETMDEVTPVSVQPALRLDEVQEQHSGEGSERQGVTLGAAAGGRKAIGEALERDPERLEEPWGDSFAGERLAHPQAQRERRLPRDGTEPLQGRERTARRLVQGDGGDARDGSARRRAPGGAHETPRTHAQRACQPPLGVCGQPPGRRAGRPLRVARLECEHAERVMPRHQRRALEPRRFGFHRTEPGPGRYRLPRHLESERPKKVAKIVDLLGAGEKVSQHGTPGSETTKVVRRGLELCTEVLRGGPNCCGGGMRSFRLASRTRAPHPVPKRSFSV